MKTKKIFLASSSELREDRQEFERLVSRQNNDWVPRGVYLQLVIWEDFLDAMSQARLQDEYNKAVRECDLFVMLFSTKVGKYTEEEFETAFGQFKATNKPFIFTYFKDTEVSIVMANENDLMSLWAFRKKLLALGHFPTVYKNLGDLRYHFDQQLEKLAASGFFELTSGSSVAPPTAAPQASPALPYLAFGSWTLRNAVDEVGLDWSNSVLKFSSQEPVPVGLQLRGTFTWRLNNELIGTEEVSGYYIAATRQITLEGERVTAPERLAVRVSVGERARVERWPLGLDCAIGRSWQPRALGGQPLIDPSWRAVRPSNSRGIQRRAGLPTSARRAKPKRCAQKMCQPFRRRTSLVRAPRPGSVKAQQILELVPKSEVQLPEIRQRPGHRSLDAVVPAGDLEGARSRKRRERYGVAETYVPAGKRLSFEGVASPRDFGERSPTIRAEPRAREEHRVVGVPTGAGAVFLAEESSAAAKKVPKKVPASWESLPGEMRHLGEIRELFGAFQTACT